MWITRYFWLILKGIVDKMWITLWKTFFAENAQKRKKSRFLKTSEKVDKNGILLFFKITFFCAILPKNLTLYSVEVSSFFVLFQTCQKRQGDRINLLYQYVFYCLTIRSFYTEWGIQFKLLRSTSLR